MSPPALPAHAANYLCDARIFNAPESESRALFLENNKCTYVKQHIRLVIYVNG